MRAGEFADGAHVLRAKIDMASPNLNMRDPTLYRIRHASHHRTGDAWCIYPMYDYAHPLSDALEGITHSLCTLEFEDHRPLYDWLVEHLFERDRPRQIEFARLNLNYTVMSKRKLLQLVQQNHVTGWDDPRMPTISGLRRRGYTPESIRDFCARIGVAKKENVIDVAQLEHSVREDLNRRAPRVMAVLRPLKVVITNYPEGQVEDVDVINNPEDPSAGTARCRSRASSTSSATTSGRIRRRSSSGWRPAARCGCAAPTSSPARGRQGRRRRDRRAALHLRSGDTRRRCARRPQGEGDAALGLGRACPAGRSAPVRSAVSGRRSRSDDEGRPFSDYLNPASLEVLTRVQGRAEPGVRRPLRRASSSSGWATSGSIPIPRRAHLSSTGPCRCATPGRESSSSSGRVPELILHGLGLCQFHDRAPQS